MSRHIETVQGGRHDHCADHARALSRPAFSVKESIGAQCGIAIEAVLGKDLAQNVVGQVRPPEDVPYFLREGSVVARMQKRPGAGSIVRYHVFPLH
ncbi:hypothetical protein [Labrenzia sp. OB1]|uniref:hypothetical protein n=1 Tax=Labrenzia sp. OB1 TaxID=1561204 RepID=UPI0012E87BBF|nr:hypothetical protein [Labrenzia sp. OB1]